MTDDNYITPVGLQRIQYEMEWLRSVERPKVVAEVSYAASMGDRSENAEYIYGKKRLRQIDSRMGFLMKCLNKIRVVDPVEVGGDTVKFGATVLLEDEEGEEVTYRIYGVHEVDIDKGIISHRSPLARAMMGKAEGDEVIFQAPGGRREFEILEVRYDAQVPDPVPEWKKEKDDPEAYARTQIEKGEKKS